MLHPNEPKLVQAHEAVGYSQLLPTGDHRRLLREALKLGRNHERALQEQLRRQVATFYVPVQS